MEFKGYFFSNDVFLPFCIKFGILGSHCNFCILMVPLSHYFSKCLWNGSPIANEGVKYWKLWKPKFNFETVQTNSDLSWWFGVSSLIVHLEELHQKVTGDYQSKQIKEIYDQNQKLNLFFNIDDQFGALATRMYEYKVMACALFTSEFKRVGRNVRVDQDKKLSHLEVGERILQPTVESLKEKVENILCGEIKTQVVIRIFDKIDNNRHFFELRTLHDFLQIAKFSEEHIELSINKIQCVFHLEQCIDMVDDILKVSNALNLEGDFSSLQMIKRKVG